MLKQSRGRDRGEGGGRRFREEPMDWGPPDLDIENAGVVTVVLLLALHPTNQLHL